MIWLLNVKNAGFNNAHYLAVMQWDNAPFAVKATPKRLMHAHTKTNFVWTAARSSFCLMYGLQPPHLSVLETHSRPVKKNGTASLRNSFERRNGGREWCRYLVQTCSRFVCDRVEWCIAVLWKSPSHRSSLCREHCWKYTHKCWIYV